MRLLLGGLLWVSLPLLASSVSAQLCLPDNNSSSTPLHLPFSQPSAQRVLRPADGLGPLYNFARAFLKAVQPNPFPEDIVSKVLKNEQQDIPKLVQYEAGYLVCLILALLYLLLMPVAGGLLLWQYFHSREPCLTSSSSPSRYYKDIGVSGCLILITLLLLVGVILAFATNSKTRANMAPSLQHLDTNVRIMEDGLASIPWGLETILEMYSIPKADISKTIHEADDAIGATIVTSFSTDVLEALTDLSIAVKDATGTIGHLKTSETRRLSLQSRQSVLQRELQQLQIRLDNLRACSTCDVPDSSNLETDADYSLIPSLQHKLDSLPPKSDFAILVEQSESTFRGIPQFCYGQLAPTTAALMLELNKTQESLMNTSHSFPSLQSFTEFVSKLRTATERSEGLMDYYDYIRWAVAVTLCFVMMVIVLLMVAALSMGLPMLFNPTIYSFFPNTILERTALWLFQAAMILSCAFSWLFISLVFVTLFFGGNAYSLGCQSFTSGHLLTFLDKQEHLFTSLNSSQGNETIQPYMSAVYQGCRRGESMFYSMNMNEQFDLDDVLNSTKYLSGFSETAKNMRVNINKVKLLSDEGRQDLLDFRDIGLESYNYDMVILLLSTPVVKRNLSVLAKELDEKAELPENADIKVDLQQEAAKTRNLHNIVIQQTADAANMNASVKALRDISRTYKANVDKTLNGFSQTEAAMQALVPSIVSDVSQCILDKAEQCILRYLDWVRHSILNDVMACGWLARSMDNVYTALCLNVIDPWNAFWLCFGWCSVFLIPEIALSIYVVRRLRPKPPAPTFFGRDVFTLADVHPEKKQHMEEKPPENTKSNIYMTLEEVLDMNTKTEKMKDQCEDT